MRWLVTSDLHFTDRPRDAYRFGLLKWLFQQHEKHKVDATFILGDITDRKDSHSAALVNTIIDGLLQIPPPLYILKGNHDYIDPQNPFFKFLNSIKGIKFISHRLQLPHLDVALIPHCQSQSEFDFSCQRVQGASTFMLHACLTGAIAETGHHLSGLQWPPVRFQRPPALVLAGDIHRPQRLANGPVYVGAPYHTRFGTDFTPRVLLVEGTKLTDLHYPAPRKLALTITHPQELKALVRGDQVKITLCLAPQEVVSWANYKQAVRDVCREQGVELFGLTLEVAEKAKRETKTEQIGRAPDEVLTAYCKKEGVPWNLMSVGKSLVQG